MNIFKVFMGMSGRPKMNISRGCHFAKAVIFLLMVCAGIAAVLWKYVL